MGWRKENPLCTLGKVNSDPDLHHVTPQVQRLLAAMDGELLRDELQARAGITDRKYFRIDFLTPAIEANLVEMTIPDKPNSSKQRYRLTASGSKLQDELTVHDRATPRENLE